jgi:hypothetical protein
MKANQTPTPASGRQTQSAMKANQRSRHKPAGVKPNDHKLLLLIKQRQDLIRRQALACEKEKPPSPKQSRQETNTAEKTAMNSHYPSKACSSMPSNPFLQKSKSLDFGRLRRLNKPPIADSCDMDSCAPSIFSHDVYLGCYSNW